MSGDQELIKGCSKGDRTIQKSLYDTYCRKMMVVCQRYSHNNEEAEDILQEAFVKVFKNIKDFRGDSRLETWITRIVINTALNHQRQALYMMPMVNMEDVNMVETEEVSLAGFHFDELISLVQSLPQGCRLVFNLFAIEGYGHKEIAGVLGITEGTSKSQYSRARMILKNKLSEREKNIKRYGE